MSDEEQEFQQNVDDFLEEIDETFEKQEHLGII